MNEMPYPYTDETPEERKFGRSNPSNKMPLRDLYKLNCGEEQTLAFGSFEMVVKKRPDNWLVSIKGCGSTCHKYLDYAVGAMLMTYYDTLVNTN